MAGLVDIDGYDLRCAVCGQRAVKKGPAVQRETDLRTGVKLTWHSACGRPG